MAPPMIFLLAFAAQAAAPAPPTLLPAYADALACAGLTQAAMDLARENADGPAAEAAAYDHATFWSLATMDAARAEGMTARDAENDQKIARAGGLGDLRNGVPEAVGRLAECQSKTPPIR